MTTLQILTFFINGLALTLTLGTIQSLVLRRGWQTITGRVLLQFLGSLVLLQCTMLVLLISVQADYSALIVEGAANLTLGDRATISNMTPEFGASAAMFYIDQQTIDYLKLTGRDDEQVKLVETYAGWLDCGQIACSMPNTDVC